MEGGGGGGGYPWGPPDSQHFATPVKQMEGAQRSLHPFSSSLPVGFHIGNIEVRSINQLNGMNMGHHK